jgi:PadR family transcriptional regulator, regulatory protein AphA
MRETPVTYVILGMLRLGATSGYEIKRAVDMSTRFFWTISPAQIYPTLRALEKEGLVRGRSEPRGRRPRRLYELTPEGEAALVEWLRRDEPIDWELRDAGTLKLFFADALEPAEAVEVVAAIRRRSERFLQRMRGEIRPLAEAVEEHAGRAGPLASLRLGIAVHQAMVDTCRELERELAGGRRRRARRAVPA